MAAPAMALNAVHKVLTVDQSGDPVYAEITNTGTINALWSLNHSLTLTEEEKTLAMTDVLESASQDGMLVRTNLVANDRFYCLDGATELQIIVLHDGPGFTFPSGTTSVIKWTIPSGVQ